LETATTIGGIPPLRVVVRVALDVILKTWWDGVLCLGNEVQSKAYTAIYTCYFTDSRCLCDTYHSQQAISKQDKSEGNSTTRTRAVCYDSTRGTWKRQSTATALEE